MKRGTRVDRFLIQNLVSIDISIIIATLNARQLLEECLTSIDNQYDGELGCEIIVVDNASTDDSLTMLRREFPGVRVIYNRENRRYAEANNQGLAEAEGKYVLFLHNDTLLRGGTLQELYDFLEAHEEAAGVGPRLSYADGRPQHSCFRFPSALNVFARLCLSRFAWDSTISGNYPEIEFQSETAVDSVSGACCLMQRELLLQYQGMDGDYYWSGEMMDLCCRLRSGGWKLYYLPTRNAVLHYSGASAGQLLGPQQFENERQHWKSRFLFIKKRYPLWKKAMILGAVLCAFGVNACISAFMFFRQQSRFEAQQYVKEQWAITCESLKLL